MTASAPTPAPTPIPPLPPPPARVTAVVPARNEAARIGATVTELRRHVDEVVVVDDASDDATGEVAAGAGAVVVRNERRLGYVGSIRRGFAVAGGDVVVTVDADGEMPVERIAELVAPIVAGEADMVQGHRSRVPRLSERLVTAVAALGGPVGDSGSGFRALRTGLARALEIPGSCICGSLALDALGRGARLAEIPIAARHVPGRRRRIAWNHLGQVAVVAGMVLRARLQDKPPADPGLVGERDVVGGAAARSRDPPGEPVRMTVAYLPQTTVDTMARIAASVDPWIAFRDFLEDWTYLPESRLALAAQRPPFANEEQRRWAALLAAAIEVLCARDGLVTPGWTSEPAFRLDEAWYLYEGSGRIRGWLRETTPPAFSSRNIWSGDRLLRRT